MTLIDQLEARTTAMKVYDVAELLQMEKSAIYDMAATGKLPSYRIGPRSGTLRFDPKQVAGYLRACNTATLAVPRPIPRPKTPTRQS